MENQNSENLEQLLGKFLDTEQARKAADEINQGEKLFALHPAPEPDERLIASIKGRVAASLSRPKAVSYKAQVCKVAAVAAAIVVWSWVGLQFFERSQPKPEIKRATVAESSPRTWSGWDTTEVDAELADLAEEIDQIEGSILALRLGEQDGVNGTVLVDIETEMVEINNSFWKG
jgi:hypothetical protein